ncbi:MAG TPA: valine--tRNA ligase, partial [Ilumatobacteraceae bacterium]|nr:valine--tRNA ligase [Ilumatobacteraceae bacterium]
PTLDGIEAQWSARWEADGVYRFDRTAERADVFSVDTPPPTVSGSLHMGTVFGYTQTDAITRYQRMAGKSVFFPIGWDDNGLATERRVQNYYGVRCDPSQPYEPGFQPPFRGDAPADHQAVPISRPNFVELCHQLTATDEAVFEDLFRRLGLSYDWSLKYETINDVSRRTSQQAFLRNLARGEAYSAEAPTVWDVDDRTAVAQAEIEDRERPGAYHLLAFHGTDDDIMIDTTRPELVVSCVALVAHPDDERFAPLVGSTVRTPIFDVEVPIVAHPLAQPDKGTGIAMVCTFGDTTDVTWWRELDLPTRSVIGRDGRIVTAEPSWLATDSGRAAFAALAGLTVKQAQQRMVELLRESGELHGEPRPITHPVKFYERGSRPLEIVTSRQWYIRNGGRDQDRREAFITRGKELDWFPDHMRHRYDHWVEGLNGDWLVSRQRFFGVPIPLWYPVAADGTVDHDHPIVPAEDTLPMDPASDVPPGFDEAQRGQPGGFVGDPDIMDTWATSSLTPQIAGRWVDDPDLWRRVFPMDIRPQGPEIIRTWLFSTVVRSHYEHGTLPWAATTINGWILDPDRKKMSKSKGNVVTPAALFDQYGTDAVRYWAIAARPGVDTAFSEEQMKVGRRLATKLLNVTKFVLGLTEGAPTPSVDAVTDPIDQAMLVRLDATVAEATAAFDGFDYARALERSEAFFWWFCDDYVELVKGRAYGSRGDAPAASARAALGTALDALSRLLAPTLPFATEEAWSWSHEGSVHATSWPVVSGVADPGVDLDAVSEVLQRVRRAKTEAKRSQRAEVARVEVTAPADAIAGLAAAHDDLADALTIGHLSCTTADALAVDVTLD